MHLTELLISAALIVVTLSGASWVLHAEWQRARCAHLTFEKTHARLLGAELDLSTEVRIEENDDFVQGESRCGQARESVGLRKLGGAKW